MELTWRNSRSWWAIGAEGWTRSRFLRQCLSPCWTGDGTPHSCQYRHKVKGKKTLQHDSVPVLILSTGKANILRSSLFRRIQLFQTFQFSLEFLFHLPSSQKSKQRCDSSNRIFSCGGRTSVISKRERGLPIKSPPSRLPVTPNLSRHRKVIKQKVFKAIMVGSPSLAGQKYSWDLIHRLRLACTPEQKLVLLNLQKVLIMCLVLSFPRRKLWWFWHPKKKVVNLTRTFYSSVQIYFIHMFIVFSWVVD